MHNIPDDYKAHGGLYRIEIGELRYFGSTKRGLYYRYKTHLQALSKGTHENKVLQQAYSVPDSVKFTVLMVCKPRHNYQYWIENMLINHTDNCNLLKKRV